MNFKKIIAYIIVLTMICTVALNTTDFYTIKADAETVTPNVTVKSTFFEGGTSYIAVKTSPNDNLAYDNVYWSKRPTPIEGGVYVDGVLNTGCTLIKLSDRYYIYLTDGKVSATEGMTVVFDGTYIGEANDGTNQIIKFEKATFKYTNGAWKQIYEPDATVKSTLLNGDTIHIKVTTTPTDNFMGDDTWKQRPFRVEGGVYVDGNLNTSCTLIKFSEFYYISLSDGGVTVNEGTTIVFNGIYKDMNGADYRVEFSEAKFRYTNGAWEQIYGPDVTVKSTFLEGDAKHIKVTTTPTDNFAYDDVNWSERPTAVEGGVYLDGTLNKGCALIKLSSFYYISLADAGITATEGTTVVFDGIYEDAKYYQVKFSKTTFKYTNGAWVQTFEPDVVTDVICESEGTTPNFGIYIYTNKPDELVYNSDWSAQYAPYSGGVYVNGEYWSDSKLVKLNDYDYYSQYFIYLPSITLADGMKVVIDGVYGDTQKVKFNKATFTYNQDTNKWLQIRNGDLAATGLTGDANADRSTNVLDFISMNKRLINSDDEINITDADINKDGYLNTADLVLIKKLLLGVAEFKESYNVSGKPTYSGAKELSIGAYCGPSRGGNGIDYRTAEQFEKFAAAGFNFVISENDAVYGKNYDANGNEVAYTDFNSSDLKKYMDLANAVGVDVIVQSRVLDAALVNGIFDSSVRAELSTMLTELNTMQNFKGLYMSDEPVYARLNNYSNVASYLNLLSDMNGKMMYTSLLPDYCDESAFTGCVGNTKIAKYSHYLNSFGKQLGLINYDHYPFRQNSSSNYMNSSWFQNLELAATQAFGKADSGITIQAIGIQNSDGYQGVRNVTKNDITYQLYSAMAYGMKNITYFTYWEHYGSNIGGDIFTNCIVSKDGTINQTMYDAVKEANAEIKKFDEVYMDFTWQGTMKIVGEDSDELLKQMSSYNSSRIISNAATNDTIIGCLKDSNGYDGFMLVNATDPSKNLTSNVTVEFKDAEKALVFVDGVQSEVILTNGTYTVSLTSGEGAFVIPFTE